MGRFSKPCIGAPGRVVCWARQLTQNDEQMKSKKAMMREQRLGREIEIEKANDIFCKGRKEKPE